jgi:hypothetical protein
MNLKKNTFCNLNIKTKKPAKIAGFLCLPSEAGKPVRLEDSGVTLTKGKIIRMARASLANGGV